MCNTQFDAGAVQGHTAGTKPSSPRRNRNGVSCTRLTTAWKGIRPWYVDSEHGPWHIPYPATIGGVQSIFQTWPCGAPNRLHRRFEKGEQVPRPGSLSDDVSCL
eukprot:1897292-Lingulodinium_polyedra.AAC.1